MENIQRTETMRQSLVEAGMKPYHIGKDGEGEEFEYISFPWVAGAELFVLIRKPNDPSTVDCVGAYDVLPENRLVSEELN